MNSTRNTLLAAIVAVMAASPAFAGQGHGKGGGKHDGGHVRVEKQGKHVQKHSGQQVRRLDDRYAYVDTRVAGCPPGLAKKNNGCLPPGQAKKLAVGYPLPPGAVYTIPRNVLVTLPPPPVGYRYAVVHNQVVLVSRNDIVVDIIRSLLG